MLYYRLIVTISSRPCYSALWFGKKEVFEVKPNVSLPRYFNVSVKGKLNCCRKKVLNEDSNLVEQLRFAITNCCARYR